MKSLPVPILARSPPRAVARSKCAWKARSTSPVRDTRSLSKKALFDPMFGRNPFRTTRADGGRRSEGCREASGVPRTQWSGQSVWGP